METTMRSHTPMRARPMAELLPGMKALLCKDTLHMFTSKKQLSSNICQTRTNVKNNNIKPMTLAEIRALTAPISRKLPQPTTTKPKPWNSSVKVDKSKPLTKDGRMKHSTVRKELDFQPKPKPAVNTMPAPVTRISIHPQARERDNGICRISGVHNIPETPVFNKPKPILILPCEVQTSPTVKNYNILFKSNNDDSFIQREKEINDLEEHSNALSNETKALEKIAENSPPISTPFKDYRNIRDYFNESEADNSVIWNDNTIMSFEKPLDTKDSKREESVIVSLCEMLNKTTFTNSKNMNQELGELMEVERETENNLKMIDNVIEMLHSMKKKQFKILQQIRKLKHKKLQTDGAKENNATHNVAKENIAKENNTICEARENNVKFILKEEKVSPAKSPITSRPTVIKSKSPSYKIPRKSLCLRKKVFFKSTPNNNSDGIQTPNTSNDRTLRMYMQMKEQMTFLNTPLAKPRAQVPDTPAITSRNLQKQLDMLYN